MVRYANRSKTRVSVLKSSTPCVTHHFPAGSLYAPYDLLSMLSVGKVMIKAVGEGRNFLPRLRFGLVRRTYEDYCRTL